METNDREQVAPPPSSDSFFDERHPHAPETQPVHHHNHPINRVHWELNESGERVPPEQGQSNQQINQLTNGDPPPFDRDNSSNRTPRATTITISRQRARRDGNYHHNHPPPRLRDSSNAKSPSPSPRTPSSSSSLIPILLINGEDPLKPFRGSELLTNGIYGGGGGGSSSNPLGGSLGPSTSARRRRSNRPLLSYFTGSAHSNSLNTVNQVPSPDHQRPHPFSSAASGGYRLGGRGILSGLHTPSPSPSVPIYSSPSPVFATYRSSGRMTNSNASSMAADSGLDSVMSTPERRNGPGGTLNGTGNPPPPPQPPAPSAGNESSKSTATTPVTNGEDENLFVELSWRNLSYRVENFNRTVTRRTGSSGGGGSGPPPSAVTKFLSRTTSCCQPSSGPKYKRILKNLSGSVRTGQLLGIIGPSGAGKSTLLECLSGQRSTGLTGQILVTDSPHLRLAYISQADHHLRQLTVRECLTYASRIKNCDTVHQRNSEQDEQERITRWTRRRISVMPGSGSGATSDADSAERKNSIINGLIGPALESVKILGPQGIHSSTAAETERFLNGGGGEGAPAVGLRELPMSNIIHPSYSAGNISRSGTTSLSASSRRLAASVSSASSFNKGSASKGSRTTISAAKVRNPHKVLVENVMRQLGLESCADVKIVNCSGGQLKRLSISLELISKPHVILLDEPTSGLDSSSCFQCVQLLRRLTYTGGAGGGHGTTALGTDNNKTGSPPVITNPIAIIATIHQPSARVLAAFDYLYVLSYDGRALYSGPTPQLLGYLTAMNLSCPTYHNPADYILEIACGDHGEGALERLAGIQEQRSDDLSLSSHKASLTTDTVNTENSSSTGGRGGPPSSSSPMEATATSGHVITSLLSPGRISIHQYRTRSEYRHPFSLHTWLLLCRTFLTILREPFLTSLRLAVHLLVGVSVAVLYGQEIGREAGCVPVQSGSRSATSSGPLYAGPRPSADQIRIESLVSENVAFLFFSLLFILFSSMMPTALTFPMDMSVFLRERQNGWYSCGTYFLAKTLADLPFQVIFPSIYVFTVYYWTGQVQDEYRIGLFITIVILLALISQSIGLLIGAIFVDSIEASVFVTPLSAIPALLFSGFFVRISTMPTYLQPVSYLSYFRFAFEALIVTTYGLGRCDDFRPSSPSRRPRFRGRRSIDTMGSDGGGSGPLEDPADGGGPDDGGQDEDTYNSKSFFLGDPTRNGHGGGGGGGGHGEVNSINIPDGHLKHLHLNGTLPVIVDTLPSPTSPVSPLTEMSAALDPSRPSLLGRGTGVPLLGDIIYEDDPNYNLTDSPSPPIYTQEQYRGRGGSGGSGPLWESSVVRQFALNNEDLYENLFILFTFVVALRVIAFWILLYKSNRKK